METSAAVARQAIGLDRTRYQVLSVLGEGSSATVFRVHDLELDEVVVLKALTPAVAGDARVVERLKREIRIARRVRHPNVARVYDLEEWDGRLCISMEYIEGETLASRIETSVLHWKEALSLLSTLALAIESAHDLGVVHRDLKPANIVLDRRGHPYILDFGIAIAPDGADSAVREVIRGSPAYMAPERWRGAPGLPASDIYSLGVLAYEVLAGHPPFHAASLRVLMAQHLHAPVPSLRAVAPEVPVALDELIAAMLEKRPETRIASATEVLRALRRIAPPQHRPAWSANEAGTTRGRVLLVDDDATVRGLVGSLLEHRGVKTIEAADGPSAVRLAEQERPDIIILDIGLPGMDGVETLRAIKALPELASRPVVMLSGSVDPQHPTLARGLGAAAFLNKPVNPDVLDLLLDKYLP